MILYVLYVYIRKTQEFLTLLKVDGIFVDGVLESGNIVFILINIIMAILVVAWYLIMVLAIFGLGYGLAYLYIFAPLTSFAFADEKSCELLMLYKFNKKNDFLRKGIALTKRIINHLKRVGIIGFLIQSMSLLMKMLLTLF